MGVPPGCSAWSREDPSPSCGLLQQTADRTFGLGTPGAQNMGVDSLFIAGGIHAAELGVAPEAASWDADREALEGLFYKHKSTRPTLVMAYLSP